MRRILPLLACLAFVACDSMTGNASKGAWLAVPRVVREASLDSLEYSQADIVFARATQGGRVVDSQSVAFSARALSLIIPDADTCHVSLIGYRSGRSDTVWYGAGILSPSFDSASAQEISVRAGTWLELPTFSRASGSYFGTCSLIVAAANGKSLLDSVNGHRRAAVVHQDTVVLDSTAIVVARLVGSDGAFRGRTIAETLDVHLSLPVLTPTPGTFHVAQTVSARSPSGDSLEYSTSEAKSDWKPLTAPLAVGSSGYLWVRATFAGRKSDTVGGAYVVKADSSVGRMKVIPSGVFRAKDGSGDAVVVSVTGFLMDSAEVTQAMFQEVMGTNPSSFVQVNSDSLAAYPVENLSWYDAIAYCNARSRKEGFDTVYRYASATRSGGAIVAMSGLVHDTGSNGYRLPTDAEWEYAYRAGTTDDYYWGSVADNATVLRYGWFDPTAVASLRTTHPVAGLIANAWKLYDMAGNVSEYVQDRYGDAYPTPSASGKATDPLGPDSDVAGYEGMRVVRGGSWEASSSALLAATSRSPADAALRSKGIGFRCVRRPGK